MSMISTPKKYFGKVSSTAWVNERDVVLGIVPTEPSFIDFEPGQFISLKVSDVNYRSYSICSDNGNQKEMAIVVSCLHNGLGAAYVKGLQVGDGVEFIGPAGRFRLAPLLAPKLFFVCTGTGIAPVISMLFKLSKEKCASRIRLYFGIRSKRQMLFSDLLESFKRELIDFNYKVCISGKEEVAAAGDYVYGRVTEHFAINTPALAQVYLCGHPEMVSEMLKKLSDMGISSDRIFHERFTVNSVGTVKL